MHCVPAASPILVSAQSLPSQERCSFFRKTGACRYGFSCSRRHDFPSRSDPINDDCEAEDAPDASRLVLCVPQMFTHYHLPPVNSILADLDDPDSSLEADEPQLLADYADFYFDVRDELEARWGRVNVLRTCRNRTDHLRGAVYVEFALGAGATWDAAESCSGRWFAGRRLTCTVVRLGGGWREAICGLNHRGRCPKGDLKCNFLHVFLNPGETVNDLHRALRLELGELPETERELYKTRSARSTVTTRRRSRRDKWSRSPSPDLSRSKRCSRRHSHISPLNRCSPRGSSHRRPHIQLDWHSSGDRERKSRYAGRVDTSRSRSRSSERSSVKGKHHNHKRHRRRHHTDRSAYRSPYASQSDEQQLIHSPLSS